MSDELPQGWVWAKMLDVLDYEGGSQPPKKDFVYEPRDGYVRLIQIRDFGDKPFPTYVPDSRRLKKVNKDDLLLARYGGSSANDSLGRICTGLEGVYNVALAKIIFDREYMDKNYVRYLFMGPWFREKVSQNSRSCQTGFNREDVEDIEFPIAPSAEQRRIVAKLEKVFVQVDACQQRLEKLPTLLKRFRQSILVAACSGRLTADWRNENKQRESFTERCEQIRITRTQQLAQATEDAERRGQNKPKMESLETTVSFSDYDLPEIPDEWGWIHIGYVAWVKGGKRLPAGQKLSESDTGQPYIRAANLKGGTVVTDDIQFVPDHLKQKIRNYTVKANDVYITIVGACIGDAGVIPEKMDGANLTENAAKITGLVGCTSVFLADWLRSPIAQQLIQTNILSAAQGKLALFRIEQLPLPLPPLAEQQEIVRRVAGLFALADQLELRLAQARGQVAKLTPALLARAFAGRLVPQNPKDEPASALLERIKVRA